MINSIVLLALGFFILVKGANYLVKGSSQIAGYFNISPWVIGIIIVGIGTSIPELSISVASVLSGGYIGLGTIIGSNSFNILFILGFSAIFSPIVMKNEWAKRDFFVNIFTVLIAIVFLLVTIPGDRAFLGLSRFEGLFFIFILILWLWVTVSRKRDGSKEKIEYKTFALSTTAILTLGGLVGVLLGGKWVVDSGAEIARILGVSEALIGLTVVSIGTSIPEFVVTIVAVIKKKSGLALGNIIGSNIFDFLGVLGVSAVVSPVAFDNSFLPDLLFTLFSAILLFIVMFSGKKLTLGRLEGLAFVLIYLVYFAFVIIRG